jgi:hypothetical protein
MYTIMNVRARVHFYMGAMHGGGKSRESVRSPAIPLAPKP